MASASRWLSCLALVVTVGCSGEEGAGFSGRTSLQGCAQVSGAESLAWDYYNGLLIAEPGFPPPPPPVGGSYSHTDFPLLGFIYPPGWMPFEIRDLSIQGVDLIRDDQTAIWRYVFVTADGAVDPAVVQAGELQAAREFFGITGAYQTVCQNRGSYEQAPGTGIVTTFDNVLVRGDTQSVLVVVQVTPLPGLPSSGIYVRTLSSPTVEFPERVYDTFMAIDWQLLVSDTDGAVDSDGDGWLDQFDEFPNDPTRH